MPGLQDPFPGDSQRAWQRRDGRTEGVGRDLDVPLTLTAAIQSTIPDADSLTLPAQKTKIIKEIRYSTLVTMGCNQCSTGSSQSVCVTDLPGDEVIVAGSEYYHAFQQGPGAIGSPDGPPARVSKEAYTAAYQPNRSCIRVGFSALSVDESLWCEVGYLRVGFESHEARAIRRTSSMTDAA